MAMMAVDALFLDTNTLVYANIVSDMNTKIQTLQQGLSKIRQIKQGMMQELLTGKTRLVKPQQNLREIKNQELANDR